MPNFFPQLQKSVEEKLTTLKKIKILEIEKSETNKIKKLFYKSDDPTFPYIRYFQFAAIKKKANLRIGISENNFQ
jgi:hypothetical protein